MIAIILLTLIYLGLGFATVFSPVGRYAFDEDWLPPILVLIGWPIAVPVLLLIAVGSYINEKLEDWLLR